ncbi:hypothetical protein L218DRAFT_131183 [Marasmius fiardii PR-910]|nr:hypothetical protein L218DRAFT_131183 [Marasmius fiardii PR-910]
MRTVIPHYPSHPPPRTTRALTLDSVIEGPLYQVARHPKTREESSIARRNSQEAYYSTPEIIPTTWWPSTTMPPTTANQCHDRRHSSLLPFQESHHRGHNRVVTEGETTQPPALSRWQCVPLPSQSDSKIGVNLHPLLLWPESAGVQWDLEKSYGRILLERVLKERWHPLRELATNPALPSMTVVHPWLPWPITVHASGMDSRGVTIADVLLSISNNLSIPIDETGRTRLSYLRGKRMFVGLQKSDIGGDVWELVLL